MTQHCYVPMRPVTFAAVAGLQCLLVSCSPVILPPSDTVDRIRESQHNSAPTFVVVGSARAFHHTIGQPATVIVNNYTECRLIFSLKGVSPKQSVIEPGRSETFNIAEGRYEYSADTQLCPGDTRPLYGASTLVNPGRTYRLTISQQDIIRGGELVIGNDTNDNLKVEVGKIRRTIGVGTTNIPLPAGTYNVTIKAKCGGATLKKLLKRK